MAEARAFFVRLNLDDMAASIDALDSTEERGQWLEGFRVGSRGHVGRESWPDAKRLGYDFGMTCHAQAEEFRAQQAAKGEKSAAARKARGGTAQPNQLRTNSEPTPNHGSGAVRTDLEPIQNPEAIIHNPESRNENNQTPPTPSRGKRAKPEAMPTEAEWVEYCAATWPDWHPSCSAEAWAYNESRGWMIGKAPCKAWKAAARTAHGNAERWGKLQPEAPSRASGAGNRGSQAPINHRSHADAEYFRINGDSWPRQEPTGDADEFYRLAREALSRQPPSRAMPGDRMDVQPPAPAG